MQQLRVGFVGWLMDYEGPECTTVAACNVAEGVLQQYQQRYPQVPVFTDYREMLKSVDLDLVVISTPNFTHAEIAVPCLEAGKHVFLEKPMGINREECDRILEAWRRGGQNLGIDFELRVSPCAARVRSLIESGEYGELRRIEYLHHQGAWLESPTGDSWRIRVDKAGGHILECTIHYIDIMRHFAGEIVSVQNTVGPNVMPQYTFPVNLCANLFFENGVLGTLFETHTHSAVPVHAGQWRNEAEYMWSMGHDMSMTFTLTGGSLAVDFLTPAIMINRFEEWPRGTGGLRVIHEKTETYKNAGYEFYHDSDKMRWEFIRRCATGCPPLQDPRDAWKSHMVCLAAEQSAREDFRRVEVDYTPPKC
jgi:predicted dehydrogenase